MESQDPHLFSIRCIEGVSTSHAVKSGERKTSHLPGDYCQLSVQLAVLQLSNHLLTRVRSASMISGSCNYRSVDWRTFRSPFIPPRIDTMTRVKTRRCRTWGRRKFIRSPRTLADNASRVLHALRYISRISVRHLEERLLQNLFLSTLTSRETSSATHRVDLMRVSTAIYFRSHEMHGGNHVEHYFTQRWD